MMYMSTLKTTLKTALVTLLILVAVTACAAPSPTATPVPTATPTPAPTATSAPTATPVPQPTATPTPVPPLTLGMLQNTTYPSELEGSGTVTLTDGRYEGKPFVEGGASRPVVILVEPVAFGDLDDDGVEDAAVILAANAGGSGTFISLEAVRNEGGAPVHLDTYWLGDRVRIESLAIESGQIVLEMITHGPDDPMCCPNMDRRQVYVLQDGSLVLLEQIDTPRTEPAIPRAVEPERIEFPPGVLSVTLEGSVFPIGDKRYMLHGHAGQTMSLAVTSPYDHVFLSVYSSDGAVLESVLDETTSWTGELPRTLEYIITLVSIAGNETTYTF